MQKIYSSDNRVLLYLLQSKLAVEGIDSIIRNEAPAGPAAGEIPPVVAKPELWILTNEHYDKAHAIIQQEITHHSQKKAIWQCPTCQEMLEGQFDVCWKCGQGRIPT